MSHSVAHVYDKYRHCALVHISPIHCLRCGPYIRHNEALDPPTHPNVAHVLDISEALVPPTHLNVPYHTSLYIHMVPIYPRGTSPGVRHLRAASELHYIEFPKSTTCPIHEPHHEQCIGEICTEAHWRYLSHIWAILWLIYEFFIRAPRYIPVSRRRRYMVDYWEVVGYWHIYPI